MKSLSIFSATTLFLLTGVLTSCSSAGDGDDLNGTDQSTAIAGYQLAPRDMSRTVRASSVAEPENIITIASRMSGLITSLSVREGDDLQRGDIMLHFDVEEQQAELERARAELELAEARYKRSRLLVDREVIPSSEYEEARASLKIAESDVKLRETRMGFGTVRAPSDLVLLERHVSEGDAVSNNAPLFKVADLDRLVVRVGIPERDVVHLERGDSAELHIDAYPDETFSGDIQRIYPSADDDSRLITVEIALETDQKDRLIRPGYLARVTMDAEQRENVLAVPSESLLASGRDERFVYIINADNRLERRDVTPGIERRNWTQILQGLETGDVVVGANPSNLREDIAVQVTRWVDDDSPEIANQQ